MLWCWCQQELSQSAQVSHVCYSQLLNRDVGYLCNATTFTVTWFGASGSGNIEFPHLIRDFFRPTLLPSLSAWRVTVMPGGRRTWTMGITVTRRGVCSVSLRLAHFCAVSQTGRRAACVAFLWAGDQCGARGLPHQVSGHGAGAL